MTLADVGRRPWPKDFPPPHMSPPVPLRSATRLEAFTDAARLAGLELMPWQSHAGLFMTAISKSGWRWPEVAIVAPRQNGKTTLLVARIIAGLLAGEKIMHTAQNRELPREIFNLVADAVDPNLMKHPPRIANGQERIDMLNGAVYRIVAPTRGGGRGPSNDLVIVDEVREFTDFDFIAAAKPTLTVSESPQTLYLSNAGWEGSVVLNALRKRSESDNDLAYVEWSAPPENAIGDRAGWMLANPAAKARPQLMATLEREFRAHSESGTLQIFETEHLSRWVTSERPRPFTDSAWMACQAVISEDPVRPAIAFDLDPAGHRASAAMCWKLDSGRYALVELIEANEEELDTAKVATDLLGLIREHHARQIGYASWTAKSMARHVPKATQIDGKDFAAASELFTRMVRNGQIAWDGAEHISADVAWIARKDHESGAFTIVPAETGHSITAINAAIRAVWLAAAPRQTLPRIG